jgi:hypothetical protein
MDQYCCRSFLLLLRSVWLYKPAPCTDLWYPDRHTVPIRLYLTRLAYSHHLPPKLGMSQYEALQDKRISRSGSRAAILGHAVALGHIWQQSSFPDYYFDITNNNHMVDLKAKFKNICKCTYIGYPFTVIPLTTS